MRRAAFAAAFLALAACDSPSAPPPKPVAVAIAERPEPVRWNAETDGFELAGKPLRAIKLWTFDDSTEGYTAPGVELVPGPTPGLRLKTVEPMLRSPSGLAVDGALYSLVLVRLTRLTPGGGGWNGALYYATPEHSESPGFFGKPVLGDAPAAGETTILVYDMARQAAGADDWKTSLIGQIRLDLDDRPGAEFLIHQVAIVEKADLSTFLPPSMRPKIAPSEKSPSDSE